MFEPPRLAPPTSGAPFAPPPPPSGAPEPLFVPQEGAPNATVVPAHTVGKRSKGKVFGGLLAVVALLGAGGFAVSKIVAGNNDGGAADPTEVGTKLMNSLADEDVLGVVDLLLPGERDMMRQPLIDMVGHLKRLGVADDTADLQKVGGLDISFQNVQVRPTATNVDDVSDIHITATGSVSVDGKKVPIGPLLIDEAFGGTRPDLGSDTNESPIDWNLATVKRGGRWYLSAFYSVAESARGGADIPESPIVAHGADTPDGAVQAIFDAVDKLDLEALIASLNPNEAEALQRYAPMFIDKAQSAVDKSKVDIAFSDAKYTVSGSGDRRTVTIDALKVHVTSGSDDVTVEIKDGCTVVTVGATKTDSCKVGDTIDSAIAALGLNDNKDIQSLIKTVRDAFADMKPVGLTVQNVGGKWYLSPVGTYADALLAVMSALDKSELTDIIDGIKKVSQSLAADGGIFGATQGGDTSGTDSSSTETSVPDTSGTDTSVPDTSGETSVPDTSGSDTSDANALDTCYQSSDYASFSACVAAGVNDGSIDATFLPPYYRFADCGVGEKYFDGSVYSMSDAEFVAFATAAAPCFQKYVDDGTIERFELPYELSRPNCLEGKNWYMATDSAYNDRVSACANA
ncbi:MAG: hypothetical protein ACXVIH_02265 [Ilumatobacteraceae bacterium]